MCGPTPGCSFKGPVGKPEEPIWRRARRFLTPKFCYQPNCYGTCCCRCIFSRNTATDQNRPGFNLDSGRCGVGSKLREATFRSTGSRVCSTAGIRFMSAGTFGSWSEEEKGFNADVASCTVPRVPLLCWSEVRLQCFSKTRCVLWSFRLSAFRNQGSGWKTPELPFNKRDGLEFFLTWPLTQPIGADGRETSLLPVHWQWLCDWSCRNIWLTGQRRLLQEICALMCGLSTKTNDRVTRVEDSWFYSRDRKSWSGTMVG